MNKTLRTARMDELIHRAYVRGMWIGALIIVGGNIAGLVLLYLLR